MSANEGDEREPALASGERRDDANAAAQTLGDAIAAAPSPSLLAPAHLAPSAPAIEAAPAAALPRADAVADAIDRGRAEPASTNEPALSVDNDQPRAAAEEEAPALDVAARPAAAPGAKGAFILVAKLFNRAALPQQAAAAALAAALKAAQQVAETWRGRAEAWSDAGVAMHFPADRVGGVEAARAARELAERLHALGGESQFRCGLHWCAAQTSRTQVADGVAEAGLLSALAPAGKLAVSEAAFVGIEPAQRASASDVPAAAVTALAAKALGRCRIVLPEAAAAEVPAAPTP